MTMKHTPGASYWMIECGNGFTGWWTGKGNPDCRLFNPDLTKGKRFATKVEAEGAIVNSCQIATEHLDIGRQEGPDLEAVQADAARYRWLTANRAGWFSRLAPVPWKKQTLKAALDYAIDTAIGIKPTAECLPLGKDQAAA